MNNKILKVSSTFFVKYIFKYSNKKMPKKIKIKSDNEQIKQTINFFIIIFMTVLSSYVFMDIIDLIWKSELINYFRIGKL